MKKSIQFIQLKIAIVILFTPIFFHQSIFAQWVQTKGPAAGIANVVMSDNAGNFISGTLGGGIYVSADNGQTWAQRVSGISLHSFSVNYMDTIGQNIFMIGTSSFQRKLYQSSNHAQTWTENPLTFQNPTGIAHIGNRMFVATNSEGLLYSDNMGVSWDTLPTYSFLKTVYPVIYSIHALGTDLFVSVQDSGVYKSSTNGTSWVHASGGLLLGNPTEKMVSTGSALWLTQQMSNVLYKSINGGLNWTLMPAVGNNNTIDDIYALNGNLYVVTDPHIYFSNDNGLTFSNFSGSVNTQYHRIAYNGSTFLSFTSFFSVGIQRSTNNGLNWTEANYGYANARTMSVFADGNNLFASTYDRDMFISSDYGLNYTRIPNPISGDLFYANDIIKVGSDIVQGGYSKMYKSSNNGTNWVNCSPGIPIGCDVKQYLQDGNDLYAATTMGVYKSTSSFSTWTPINTGIAAGTELYSIVKNGTRLFVCGKTAAYDAKVFYSDNNGNNWTDISAGFGFGVYTSADKMVVSGPNILLAAAYHLYGSTDNGLTWNLTGNGMPFGLINTFYSYANDLYAGMGSGEDPNGDILISRDNGTNWFSIKDDLFNSNVTSITVLNGDLYVGTFWGGVWKRPLSSITIDVQSITKNENALDIYPNPAAESVVIKNPSEQEKQLRFLSTTGSIVYSAKLKSGSIEISTKEIPNGVYLVQCVDEKSIYTHRLVICH